MARGRSAAARNRGRKAVVRDAPPDVFRDMLGDLDPASPSSTQNEQDRPVKRRRGAASGPGRIRPAASNDEQHIPPAKRVARREKAAEASAAQVVDLSQRHVTPEDELQEIDFNPEPSSEESDQSDEFEDVDIEGQFSELPNAPADKSEEPGARLDLVLGSNKTPEKGTSRRRRLVTGISDKKLALQTHQIHLLCLLAHLSLRNHWCNDPQVQKMLRRIVPRKAREEMDDNEDEDQYTRDQKLRNGLREAMRTFNDRFKRTANGLRRSWWDAPENDISPPSLNDLDLLTSVIDFRNAARELAGSRDVGAQLFCAMLRGLGLEVRLICSLQPLPLNGSIRPQAPIQHQPLSKVPYRETRTGMGQDGGAHTKELSIPSENEDAWKVSSIRRRLGGSVSTTSATSPVHIAPRRSPEVSNRLRESSQPIFWVEVFNPAYQRWISVDALVTESLGQPSKLEPAQKDIRNNMSCVVGMEEDGSLRDITRRYATSFNAKTRKIRVDAIAGSEGSRWWQRVLRLYSRPIKLAKDDIEDAEMQRREEREGMPKNVEDFKGHPLYVLERHLRRNEVIHPKREVGRTGAGKAGDELVFRRRDVHTVKSADAWYRVGRELKVGEQPLKRHVPKRKSRNTSPALVDGNDEETVQNLYAVFQTELYRAPPVKDGLMPRNAYGNLDVYVPSMIPAGAVHFLHPNTKHAAKLLGVDYVDAVTGFEFKGRQGNPVLRGAVIAAEYKDAILEVLKGMANERAIAEAEALRRECLRLWRRFLTGLRVRERIFGHENDQDQDSEGDSKGDGDGQFKISKAMDKDDVSAEALENEGGFVPEDESRDVGHDAERPLDLSFFAGDHQNLVYIEGPKLHEPSSGVRERLVSPVGEADEKSEIEAGGFLPEGDGGFLPDEGGGIVSNEMYSPEANGGLDGTHDTEFLFEGAAINTTDQGEEQYPRQAVVDHKAPRDSEERMKRSNGQAVSRTMQSESGPADGLGNPRPEVQKEAADMELEEDRGSLLSEDPDDSDAMPDWLV